MEEIPEFTDHRLKYGETLNLIKGLPGYLRIPTETRFLLIKEYEELIEKETKRLGKNLRKVRTLKEFCVRKKIEQSTFYRYLKLYRDGGIEALVLGLDKDRSGSLLAETVRPIIHEISNFDDLKSKYSETLDVIKNLPDYQKIPTENRFILIKEFESYRKKEAERLGKKFRKLKAMQEFCDFNGINPGTFYSHLGLHRDGGIEALVPAYGNRKGKGPVAGPVLPLIRKIIEPGKGYKPVYDNLVTLCKQRDIKTPSYDTFRRIVIANGLSDIFTKKKAPQEEPSECVSAKPREKQKSKYYPFKVAAPEWIRVVDKKAFNIAMYKYALVLPFLSPDLDRKERKSLIEGIVARKHQPLSGVTIGITRPSLLKWTSIVKEEGFDGLVRKHQFRKGRRHKNMIWATPGVDMNNPLACLQQVKEIIENGMATDPNAKEVSLRLLDHYLTTINTRAPRYKPVFLTRPLTDHEMLKLEAYKVGIHKNQRVRAIGLLMANENRSMLEIITATGRSDQTIYLWLRRFKKEGIKFVETKLDCTKNNVELRERKDRIVKILHCQPKDYNINRTSWKLEDIAKIYDKEYGKKLSTTAIRRSIKSTGYSIKRAIRVLTSKDPEYREKTKKVLDTLRNLGPNEAFFFIDEAGPWQVKKYGGKSFTPKGTIRTFPQFQTPKGRVTFIGALDALKNQSTLFFTKTKDTAAVVCLIKILFFKYHDYSTLYLTWDCASWHRSKGLQACLDRLNAADSGPTIKVVPLPKMSQFLNVIEAVFSGMKRAVIFNSDYNSEYEMKMAIYRHTRERNEFYRVNPKKAGNKIWDKEYYNLDKIDSGIFKKI